tara:strand:+ start:7079 stop:7300 length:222 start_codon:yes stop_codon:yes gene_type:complete
MNEKPSIADMKFVVDCSGIAKHWGMLTEFWWSFECARRSGVGVVQSAHYALEDWDVYPFHLKTLSEAEGFGII